MLSAIEMLHDIALYKFNIHIHIHIRVGSGRTFVLFLVLSGSCRVGFMNWWVGFGR